MNRTWKPVVASVLQFLASIPYLVAALELYFVPGFLPEEIGGGRIWAAVGFLVWFPFALPLLIGGTSALTRRAWGLAFIGAVAPLALTFLLSPWQGTRIGMAFFFFSSLPQPVCQAIEFLAYVFMVASAVLIALSRREFTGRRSAAEHIYGPPNWWHGTQP